MRPNSSFSFFAKRAPAFFFATLVLFATGMGSRCLAALPIDQADLVVGYGATEAARWGGAGGLQSYVYSQIASANGVAANSGTPARQRVVGFIQSAQDGEGRTSTGGMVGWLAGYDGRIADVPQYGDAMKADLVTYICNNNDSGSIGAVAQQPGRYSAYNHNALWYLVWAHESGGHNFDLDHRGGVENPKTVMLHNYCGGGSQGYYSNPNIWLNGMKLIGTGSCLGGAVDGGDNAYKQSTTAQDRFDAYDRLVYGSLRFPIAYRWQFTNSAGPAPAGTVIADEVASAPAIVRGTNATFTGTALRLPGGTTGNTNADSIAAYVDLPNGIFSAMPNFTIEIWAAPQSAQNWMRLIDIGRTTEAGDGLGAAGEYTGTPGSAAPGGTSAYDDLTLTAAIGASLNSQRFEAKLSGSGTVTVDSTLTTTAGGLHYYVITFDDTTSGGTVKWYRDGTLVKTLNVAFHSASLNDVNNWLGRSMYSGDSMANIDYYDVRIQGVVLKDGNVAANYLIGPNDKVVTMWASDALGNSGFTSGAWEFGQSTPDANHDYETGTLRLRTPDDSAAHTFPGRSLSVTGGSLLWKGTASSTITVNDLRMDGGSLIQAGSGTMTLAGNLTVANTIHVRAANGPINMAGNISGFYSILYTENAVTLTGNNSGYNGGTTIGDGRFSTLSIDSEARLGANPPWYGGDWLEFNRGILVTTATMTINDANRGILIGPSGGFFRPNAGTTLTIASLINSPAAGDTLQTSPLSSNPTLGILVVDGQGVVEFSNPNNSHNAEMQILAGELRLTGNGRLNNGSHSWPITINGTFRDNSALDQTLSGVISGSGSIVKTNTSTLTISGANTYSGGTYVNAGTLTVTGTSANPLGTGTVTVNSSGTLNPAAASGTTVTLANTVTGSGSISTTGAGSTVITGDEAGFTGTLTHNVANGSVQFNSATSGSANAAYNLAVASTASQGVLAALNGNYTVNLGSLSGVANSLIRGGNTATGTTTFSVGNLGNSTTFAGLIANGATKTIALTKVGTGTLTLSGDNTYTGNTAINAGKLISSTAGSAKSAFTVSSGATNGILLASAGGQWINTSNVTQNAGSKLDFDFGAFAPSTTVAPMSVANFTVNATTTLRVAGLPANFAAGQTYPLVAWSGTGPANTNGIALITPALVGGHLAIVGNKLSLVMDTAGPSAPATLTNSVSGNTLNLSWPAGQSWRLQQQTNNLTIGLGTNWVYITDGSIGSTNITIDPTCAAVFYRLIFP